MFFLIRFIKSLFIKKPNRKLLWTVNDFQWGKKWAQTQPHPRLKNKTLWDDVNSKASESTEVLHEINKQI
jgi:acid phosphatase class B